MKRAFMKGNDAVVCGALAAGCRAFFGYPITPASEIAHDAMTSIPNAGGIAIQAESEVSAINMLYGAGACGAPAMTATSGPGFSLMQEGMSYMAAARIPGVIVDVMRTGPGLGNIGPEQGDYIMAVHGGGHGDYDVPVFAPANVSEMFEMTRDAFRVAFAYRSPVVVLADAFIGQMMEIIDLPDALCPLDQTPAAIYPFEDAADGREQTCGHVVSSLELNAAIMAQKNDARFETYQKMQAIADAEYFPHDGALDILVVAYGICASVARAAVSDARANGVCVGFFRPKTLFPFDENAFSAIACRAQCILVVECSRGQFARDIERFAGRSKVCLLHRDGGIITTRGEVQNKITSLISESHTCPQE